MKLTDPVPAAFALRRARLASAMQSGVAVVPTAPERIRTAAPTSWRPST